jgi:hypothetical protein
MMTGQTSGRWANVGRLTWSHLPTSRRSKVYQLQFNHYLKVKRSATYVRLSRKIADAVTRNGAMTLSRRSLSK